MKQQQPERRQFGITNIEVQDDEFFNGFQTGHLLHRVTPYTTPLTDSFIYTLTAKVTDGKRGAGTLTLHITVSLALVPAGNRNYHGSGK